MGMKLYAIVLLSLLALGNAGDFTAASFSKAPVQVFETTTTMMNFQTNPLLGNYIDNTTVVVYGITKTGAAITYSVTRRYLSTATWALSSVADVTADTGLKTIGSFSTTQNGYAGIANADIDVASIGQAYISYFPSNFNSSNDIVKAQITSNTDILTSYVIYQVLGLDSYVYVLYSSYKANKDVDLYLQGYLTTATKATTKFGSPIKINTVSFVANNQDLNAKCGSNPATNSLVCGWKYKKLLAAFATTMGVTVDLAAGSASGEIILYTDDATTTYGGITNVFSGGSYFVALTLSTKTAVTPTTVNAFINSTSSATTLAVTLPTGYDKVTYATGARYYDGFFVIYLLNPVSATPTPPYSVQAQAYKADGSVNGSALSLGTITDLFQGIALADSSYAVYLDDVVAGSNPVTIGKGYVGQLYSVTRNPILPNSAAIFKGVMALLSFVLLSVFAF